jgi:hypothetical protein
MLWIAHLSEDLVYLGDHLAVHEKEVLTGSVVKLDLAVRGQGRTWWFPAPFPERILRGVGECRPPVASRVPQRVMHPHRQGGHDIDHLHGAAFEVTS